MMVLLLTVNGNFCKFLLYTWYLDVIWSIGSQVDNAKYRCKWDVKHLELVHFQPLPGVVENILLDCVCGVDTVDSTAQRA